MLTLTLKIGIHHELYIVSLRSVGVLAGRLHGLLDDGHYIIRLEDVALAIIDNRLSIAVLLIPAETTGWAICEHSTTKMLDIA